MVEDGGEQHGPGDQAPPDNIWQCGAPVPSTLTGSNSLDKNGKISFIKKIRKGRFLSILTFQPLICNLQNGSFLCIIVGDVHLYTANIIFLLYDINY